MRQRGARVAALQVRLAVEVLRLHVRDVLLFGASAYEDVRGERLVVRDLDDVAHPEVLPDRHFPVRIPRCTAVVEQAAGLFDGLPVIKRDTHLLRAGWQLYKIRTARVKALRRGAVLEVALCALALRRAPERGHHRAGERLGLAGHGVLVGKVAALEDTYLRVVDTAVGLVPLEVLVAILEGGDGEHDEEGEDDEAGGDGGEDGEELEDGDGQEEDVCDAAELLEEIAGEKGDDGVLGRDDLVGAEDVLLLDAVLVVVILCRDGFVDEDGAGGPGPPRLCEEGLDIEVDERVVPHRESGRHCRRVGRDKLLP